MPEDSLKRSRSPEDTELSNKRPYKSSTTSQPPTASEIPNSDPTNNSQSIENSAPSQVEATMSMTSETPTTNAEPGATDPAIGGSAPAASAPPVPVQSIHMRCLIVTSDASVIIGRSGAHVNEIREKSGARVMVSESIPGNPERILNVNGPLDAVSKVGR